MVTPPFLAKIAVGSPPQVTKIGFNVGSSGIPTVIQDRCVNLDRDLNESNYKDSLCFKPEFIFNPDASTSVKRTGLICDTMCNNGPTVGEIMYDKFGVS